MGEISRAWPIIRDREIWMQTFFNSVVVILARYAANQRVFNYIHGPNPWEKSVEHGTVPNCDFMTIHNNFLESLLLVCSCKLDYNWNVAKFMY